MSKLYVDVLHLIFEKFQGDKDDKKSLISCLSVNITWCELIVPILWKNPWEYLKIGKEKILLKVIISHFSDELRNNLSQDNEFLIDSYKRPLFNYISFWRHLNLERIERMFNAHIHFKEIKNDLLNLFINNNTKFTHLYIYQQFNRQIHLIPESKQCFSDIKFLSCNASIDDYVLIGLIEMCESIKELEIFIEKGNKNYGIIKLIKSSKKLFNISLIRTEFSFSKYSRNDESMESFCNILENSLINHSNTIKYFKLTKQPITKILSHLINLKILELDGSFQDMAWDRIENLSLPYLQILKAKSIPIKYLTNLIENTNGYLIEIKIDYIGHDEINNKRIIKAIYQNCPNLQYLNLMFRKSNILELEKLLIKCQYLNGLFFIIDSDDTINWDKLFEILTKFSPNNLFNFKFYSVNQIKLNSLKLFFDNWKVEYKHPMLLKFFRMKIVSEYVDLVERYKIEGVVKKFDHDLYGEDFEWI
ncbi:uncharacterized protein OCT59_016208 [Rhizophagus irregularis]|uniref:F-box domain-containing protein n=2 Tax=Rhizophagus irregularis TaxID=588596 RepID=U9U197_RHIID|nr:hypothetical protein GLOIN_2v1788894 [Rhizophagus irregularis DAOM 181602=DAOM 197198]EXX52658.1 hypothetical protein RirG_251150 [Rhizophagus irregularis DAOM 197198w]POG59620.1 hypothetical protein GLOIN_2v1788894 [Rhizophagus irregularis DAOM 181602=DAOM 197198]UZO23879.1 hypothetical protein OCT59_016208 [Rhizophagus irregularis]|eukprot:XP_025166486.1 hypothetical protein GLOIN_2v1788894 [Rhizophagus irregularis DAOM 181602=DAOM 197198]